MNVPDEEPEAPRRVDGWTVPAGYQPDSVGVCRWSKCRAVILWARTPTGKRAPLDRDGVSHFASCPGAATFRALKRRAHV